MSRKPTAAASLILAACIAGAQADRMASVDGAGVLRWQDNSTEVALLGVNYYTPFTIDYQAIKDRNLDHRQVIRDDVAHFRRLGLVCVRIHCFDREISDPDGNLVDNIHLELLDFVIDECRRNGLYTLLTPIAWWGNGVHTRKTNGFSDKYTMQQLTTDRAAWAIQAHFLQQFARHVNRFTGRRYADDPCVLAFECINEPLYPKNTPDKLVSDYINTLVAALRASGTAKPIYYNSWQNRNQAAGASKADGVSAASYPTGLVAGHELRTPQLCAVRETTLKPDASIARKSRIVYEFDAADVGASYMYPAMAKLFRAEGVQIATQFQYDPLPLADANVNWQTHHLNLVYTPGKAISLAIAAEVMARVPRGTPYVPDAEALNFPPFRVSVAQDLSEMATIDSYLHSNATQTQPPDPAALRRIWGRGPSPLVICNSRGAYFLDRAAPGVWRLQRYPDVFTAADPYTGSDEAKVHLIPDKQRMTLKIPDLGKSFQVWRFAEGRTGGLEATARDGCFASEPGDYLLTRASGLPSQAIMQQAAALAPRFVAPSQPAASKPLVRGTVAPQWRAGVPLALAADAACTTSLTARLTAADGRMAEFKMQHSPTVNAPHLFNSTLPGNVLTPGTWSLHWQAVGPGGVSVHPDAKTLQAEWMPAPGTVLPLISIPDAAPALMRNGVQTAEVALVKAEPCDPDNRLIVKTADPSAEERKAIRLTVGDFGEGKAAAGFSMPLLPEAAAAGSVHGGLRVKARAGESGARIEIGFRMRNGQGLGCNLWLGTGWSETVIPARKLIPLWGLTKRDAFLWPEAESVSVLTGAWLFSKEETYTRAQTIDIAALEWVPLTPALRLEVLPADGAWHLFDPADWLRIPLWSQPLRRGMVNDDQGRPALHLGADRFDGDPDPHSLSLQARREAKTFAELWQTEGEEATLLIRARAARPRTTGFELTFIERDNVAWGTVVPLTAQWQKLEIPVRNLRLFTHWDQTMPDRAGTTLRVSRLESISLCFGKWLYPEAAAEPHAFEISEISIQLPAR
ncbi:MAG: cellulase family glycosylhydrolase [Kiritimatiellae bacterium]|nr:cellulase family glycosylhydrolase [Kiritimatiellia bacterium]